MTTDAKTIARRAYQAAYRNVTDVKEYIDLFADDGMFHTSQKR